ncbi:NAD(P)H-binding protein [Actinomadura rubrisoli]|uniref:NAD-dependent epimerase/dehydratase family protein n=1 Tax=Actinomadura rubrisoli TaxID=2530368 RepID=A0A4R5A0G5_9ACTN|nr:NAD(P)H-binding protein [Actinomadura rubrisoli]TDD63939.1 NAD-dependent epimerase/dehydratase family protein [Actinomadura rubrisoli]
MKIVIAGGHGKVALRLTRLLAERGDDVVGIVRNPDHVDGVRQAGGDAVVLDLERATAEEVAATLADADAVVFSAGSGNSATATRRDKVDRAAPVLLMDAAEQAGVRRFLHVSSINVGCADNPDIGSAVARFDRVSRDDVAAVLVALLDRPDTAGRAYVLVGGKIPIDQALTSMNWCDA